MRKVACPGCYAPANAPCVNYPSGRPATQAHSVRMWRAITEGFFDPPERNSG